MAELLFKAIDASNADPAKDARGCYKRGDFVLVRDDGWGWGLEETKPPASGGKFVIIKITDVTAEQVTAYVQRKWAMQPEDPQKDADGNPIVRRRLSIPIAALPASVRSTLNQTGTYSTTWSAIRQYVTDKQTSTTASGDPIQ